MTWTRLRAVPAKQLCLRAGDRHESDEPESAGEVFWTSVRRSYQDPPLQPPGDRAPLRSQPRSRPLSVRSSQKVRPSPPATVTRKPSPRALPSIPPGAEIVTP